MGKNLKEARSWERASLKEKTDVTPQDLWHRQERELKSISPM